MSGLFLISSLMGGYVFAHTIIRHMKTKSYLNELAMSTGIGFLISGWITYIMSYIFHVICNLKNPKIYGNIISISSMIVLFLIYVIKNKNKFKDEYVKYDKITWIEMSSFFFLFFGILISMFYVFRMEGNILKAGATIFSDFSPHTAMIRSFSYHNNFPTQYPHYGGADVKYHFMFQFLAGNLEYLGMRIDWAFNWISATSLWGFLVLLYSFTKRITGYGATGAITIFMFFCRSSFAGLEKLIDCIASGKPSDFFKSDIFIGYTLHEDWGLWNYNVFLNQRHLCLGLLLGIIAIYFFYEYLTWIDDFNTNTIMSLRSSSILTEETSDSLNKKCDTYSNDNKIKTKILRFKTKIKEIFFCKDAWIFNKPLIAVLIGIILGLTAFWNGAVVIATLLILFGFAIFSKHKLDYLITAVITLILSFAQTNFFIDKNSGQNIGIKFLFGFISEDKSLNGIATYLLLLSGIFFIGVVLFLFVMKGTKRILSFVFLFPFIFAFTISMTPDVTVNHKYIIISTIFLNILWSYALVWLWKHFTNVELKVITRIIVIALLFLLTITGVYDIVTIYQMNKNAMQNNMEGKLITWLKENTTEEDLILTGQDSMSEVTLSGAMIYNGWPYYAWSAGYDTDYRKSVAQNIYSSNVPDIVKGCVEKENIDYILYFDGLTYENVPCTNEVIKELYPCVYDDGFMKLYKTQN